METQGVKKFSTPVCLMQLKMYQVETVSQSDP